MAQGTLTPAISKSPWSLQNAHFAWGSALIGVLTLAVYYRVLAKLVTDWWQIPDFSHGFLVPVFAAYLVWAKRKTLLEIRLAPTWSGIASCRPGTRGPASGCLRRGTVSRADFAGDPVGGAGAEFWRLAAS